MKRTQIDYQIHPDLEGLLRPVDDLTPLPEEENANHGDVPAIMRSLETFGQRKPIVGRRLDTGEIVINAGNHTLEAAKRLGWESIAVVVTDDDPDTAAAFGLADNRTGELGTTDQGIVARILGGLAPDPALLAATAYQDWEVADILDAAAAETAKAVSERGGNGLGSPVVAYQIIFDDEAQQKRWYEFMRWLRDAYPDADTGAERLDAYLQSVMEAQ